MADVVGLELAVGQVPHLDVLVPAAADDDGVRVVGREPHAGDPVAVTLLLDGVLALRQGVPQLDGLVPRPRHDLPVVGGEGHGHDVLGKGGWMVNWVNMTTYEMSFVNFIWLKSHNIKAYLCPLRVNFSF